MALTTLRLKIKISNMAERPTCDPAPSMASLTANSQGPDTLDFRYVFKHTLLLPVLGTLHLLLPLAKTFFLSPFAPSEPSTNSNF